MNYSQEFTNKLLQNIFNAYALHKLIVDEDGNPTDYEYIDVNPAFEILTSTAKEAVIGKKVTEVFPGINEAPFDWLSFFSAVALTGTSNSIELFESSLNQHLRVNAYCPEAGYFVAIYEDITKYKFKEKKLNKKNEVLTAIYEELAASEEELAEQNKTLREINEALVVSEGRLKRSQALAHVGNWEVDIATNELWASEEALKIYGLDPLRSFLPFNEALVVINEEDDKVRALAFKRLIENNEKYDLEFRVIHAKTQEERIVHSVASLLYDNQGKPSKVIGVIRDITDLKAAEQKLIQTNENLYATYEQLLATDEEVRSQNDELIETNARLLITKERLKKAQELAHVGNWEIDLDTKEMWGSSEAFRLYGLERKTPLLPLALVQKAVTPEDRPKLDTALKLLITENAKYDLEFSIIHALTGEKRIMHSYATLEYDANGRPAKVLGVIQDITDIKEAENRLLQSHEELTALYEELTAQDEELRQNYKELELKNELIKAAEERYALAVEGSNDGLWDWDMVEDKIHLSPRCLEITNLDPNKLESFTEFFKTLIHDDDKEFVLEDARRHFAGETPHSVCEYRIKGVDGRYTWVLSKGKALFTEDGKVIRMTGSITDYTAIKKYQETIHNLAYYDSLTGLPNRVLFEDRLTNAISLCKRANSKLAVIYFDLDDFKKINDSMGHFSGNELLIKISAHLKTYIRDCDTLSRLGGDEFAILLLNVLHVNDVLAFLERLQEAFDTCFEIRNTNVNISSSFGVALFPDDGDNSDELLKNADTAMYRAKELGKNNFQTYNIEMKEALLKKLTLEVNLRDAVANNQFVLHFQPQINIESGTVRGFEALVRWNDPDTGLIPPLEFIPIAEETGLIAPIGEWILRQACISCKNWQQESGLELIVSVNISTVQFKQKNFIELVENILLETGYPPHLLEIELTESVMIDSFNEIVPKLMALRSLGVKLSMDDFGTGYSSFNYLKMLPIHTLKIDKTFVDDIQESSVNNVLVGSIIGLVHQLDLEVIAEGVETNAQLSYLKIFNCDIVQGYLFSKPLPEDEILAYLKQPR